MTGKIEVRFEEKEQWPVRVNFIPPYKKSLEWLRELSEVTLHCHDKQLNQAEVGI